LLTRNAERFLKGSNEMRALFVTCRKPSEYHSPADRLQFSLQNLGYQFPTYPVPEGETIDSFLRKQTFLGARGRYGDLTPKVRAQLEHELTVITKLGFAGYFSSSGTS
jgi:error-prone DNA polymerase